MSARQPHYVGLALIVSLVTAVLDPAGADSRDTASRDAVEAAPGTGEPAQMAAEVQQDHARANDYADCVGQENVIRVAVNGVGSDLGTITTDLHGERPEEFLKKKKKLLRVRVPAKPGTVRFCFQAPQPGVFAIGLYHDENANRRFDKDFFGLPAEPYGVSNNPRILFGPPSHEESAFVVGPEGVELEITLRD